MSIVVNISLFGFAPFEATTFGSFFKLAGRRDTVYKIVDAPASAKIFLINSNAHLPTASVLASLLPGQKVLFVGQPDPTGVWPCAPRPIRLTTVLGLLDATSMASDDIPASKSETSLYEKPEPVRPVQPVIPAVVTAAVKAVQSSVTLGRGQGQYRSSDFAASNFMGLAKPIEQDSTSQQYDEILIVDDSDVALKFMQNRLTRYGFRARLARSGEEALSRVAAENYKFVFMDVMMDGLDGYQTCRAIKQKKYSAGKAPIVVMLTSRGGSIDKIRGGLAGCDAYLTKPLNEAELLKVLSKFDEQVERSFKATTVGASGMTSRSAP